MLQDPDTFIPSSTLNSKVALANLKAGYILRAFRFVDEQKYIALFNIYVRPIIEYCSEVFNPPANSKLAIRLESPLRRFTKKVCIRCNLQYSSYKDRLSILNTQSCYSRRIGIDILQAHKMLSGKSELVRCPLVRSRNLRHRNRLVRQPVYYHNENWFFARVEKQWNCLTRNSHEYMSLGQLRNFLRTVDVNVFGDVPRFLM